MFGQLQHEMMLVKRNKRLVLHKNDVCSNKASRVNAIVENL